MTKQKNKTKSVKKKEIISRIFLDENGKIDEVKLLWFRLAAILIIFIAFANSEEYLKNLYIGEECPSSSMGGNTGSWIKRKCIPEQSAFNN